MSEYLLFELAAGDISCHILAPLPPNCDPSIMASSFLAMGEPPGQPRRIVDAMIARQVELGSLEDRAWTVTGWQVIGDDERLATYPGLVEPGLAVHHHTWESIREELRLGEFEA